MTRIACSNIIGIYLSIGETKSLHVPKQLCFTLF